MEDAYYRRNIRAVAEISGVVPGYTHVEGDLEMEVTSDTLPYFLYAARTTPAKAGGPAPFTYTFVPANVAKATTATGPTNRKTLSLTIVRGSNPFGYVGNSVGQIVFTVDGGVLIATMSVIGSDEAAQSNPSPTWPTSLPFGPGKVTLEIPDGTPRADMDTFTLTINDNLIAANRLNGQRKSAYQNWGEREITMGVEADFDTLTDYTNFKNKTSQTVEVLSTNNVTDDEVSVKLRAAIINSYAVNLSSLGDVNRVAFDYQGILDPTGSYQVVIKTTEDVVVT
jgi:hypothetical protein